MNNLNLISQYFAFISADVHFLFIQQRFASLDGPLDSKMDVLFSGAH